MPLDNESATHNRRDLLLMTGLATAGAVVATSRRTGAEIAPGSVFVDVKNHGAVGDGATDDSDAVRSALVEAAAGRTPATVYFPRGTYTIRAGVIRVPSGSPMTLRGDGPDASILALPANETDPAALVNLEARFASLEGLSLDGGGARNGGDLVAMNAGYNRISHCSLSRAPASAIAVGKNARSLAHMIENVIIRDAREHGIRVHGIADSDATGSTDGLWSNIDVGRSGLSGVYLQSSSQNMSNVHVWQSGVRSADPSDRHGFRVASRNQIFSGCQSEKNLGDGFRFDDGGGEGSVINGCRVWENGGAGIAGVRTHRLTISATTFARNGRNNVGDSSSRTRAEAAAIHNEQGNAWSITGCLAWDDSRALESLWVPEDSHTRALPARGDHMTQTFAYAETDASGPSTIMGGVLRAEDHFSNRSINSGAKLVVASGADLGADNLPTVEASSTIRIPPWASSVRLEGTARVTRFEAGQLGHTVTLLFSSASTLRIERNARNARLAENIRPIRDASVTLIYNGDTWLEQARMRRDEGRDR